MRIPAARWLAALAALAAPSLAHAADPVAGERVFKTQCGTCHAVAPGRNLVGPTLAGIVGRKAGEVAGFRYSAANKAADTVWDEAALDRYIANPKAAMPGTSMLYAGLKNDDSRADLVAYLATLK